MAKILITGGAGFVGYHLAKRLAEQGNDVVIADNFLTGSRDAELESLFQDTGIRLVEADLTDRVSWGAVGGGYDHVYHLLSISRTKLFYDIPHEVLRVGIMTAMNVLDWFHTENKKPGAKILFTSSNEVYIGALEAFGQLPIPTPENVPLVIADPYNPRWSYAGQKLIGELLFIHYAKAYGFRMSIVRMHNLYGPRAGYQPMIPKLILQAEKRTDPFPILGPEDSRTFCYVEDAVEALQKVMESPKTDGGTYNIADHREMRVRDLAEAIFDIMQWRPKHITEGPPPENAVEYNLPDVSKIKKDTGWEVSSDAKENLRKTVLWYQTHRQA